ncbi:MAG: hypothetical protein U0V87_07080 [Acidobacteriota bacterium]
MRLYQHADRYVEQGKLLRIQPDRIEPGPQSKSDADAAWRLLLPFVGQATAGITPHQQEYGVADRVFAGFTAIAQLPGPSGNAAEAARDRRAFLRRNREHLWSA